MQEKPNEKMFDGFQEGEILLDDEEVEKMIGEPYPNEEDAKVINGRQT